MENKTYRKEYFIYKGVAYGIGTTILLSEEGCKKHYIAQKYKDKPYTFMFGDSSGKCVFNWIDERGGKFGASGVVIQNFEEDVGKIISPVYVQLVSWQAKAIDNMINKKVSPDIFGGVLLYIMVMIVGAIFIDRWLIWIGATAAFILWLLEQYRT